MSMTISFSQLARDGRKRSRYSDGLVPTRRANARRIVSAVPKPAVRAISSTAQSVVSSRRRATSTRTLLDVGGRRAADLVAEHAGEVARAHRDTRREPLDAVVVVGMLDDPLLQIAHRLTRRRAARRAAR